MKDDTRFDELVRSLISHVSNSSTATEIDRVDIELLRSGLGRALTDAARFDGLMSLLISISDVPVSESDANPLPASLREQIFESGLDEIDDDNIIQLARTPEWVADLWDALTEPTQIARDAVARLNWVSVLHHHYPVRVLLGVRKPSASASLREIVSREVACTLALAPTLTEEKVVEWVSSRVCGPEPILATHREHFQEYLTQIISEHRTRRPRKTFGFPRLWVAAAAVLFAAFSFSLIVGGVWSPSSQSGGSGDVAKLPSNDKSQDGQAWIKPTGPTLGLDSSLRGGDSRVWLVPRSSGYAVVLHQSGDDQIELSPRGYDSDDDRGRVELGLLVLLDQIFHDRPGTPARYLILITDRPAAHLLSPVLDGGHLTTIDVKHRDQVLAIIDTALQLHHVKRVDQVFLPPLK